MANASCLVCGAEFYIKPSHIKRGWGKYCSVACRHKGQLKGEYVDCFTCGKSVYKSPFNLTKSKSGKHFCSKRCQSIWRNEVLFIGDKHSNWKHGKSAYRRILKSSGKEQICLLCRMIDKRVLIVHHCDKNRNNNAITNLVWLCNNCHYLVHHYINEKNKLSVLLEK